MRLAAITAFGTAARWAVVASLSALAAVPAHAERISSVYTRIGFDTDCVTLSEYEAGVTLSCGGFRGYGILFSEGDLRQTLFFGYVGSWFEDAAWESFGPFNSVNDTVEWRLNGAVPFATILRWRIDNGDPDGTTGKPGGEVLVISKVAQPGEGEGCVVGYVDAKANAGANDLARKVADEMAEDFTCREDEPVYHGERGPLAADPMRNFGN